MPDRSFDEILDTALDLDESQRSAFLDAACRDDPELRAEVESLLAIEESHPELLRIPIPAIASVPERIGPYRIVGEVGRGGMGIVYRADDPRRKREIALKILPRHLAGNRKWREQFRREAETLAAMHHSNIATIYTLEEDAGLFFLTMELLPEGTLRERLAHGPLPLVDALLICRSIARALEAIHKKQFVHCDLKPTNISLAADDVVKVLDFGLARGDHRQASATEGLDSSAPITGTPGYMSPEQVQGLAPGRHADIWAFGCILYECLTGLPAIRGETTAEKLDATLAGEIDFDRIPPETPARLRKLLASCLAVERAQRLDEIREARRGIEQELEILTIPTAVPEAGATIGNLPLRADSFIGREEDKRRVERLLAENRLVTLAGPGGSGKTRLACEAARDLSRSLRDGAWLIDLTTARDELSATQAASTVLGVQEEPNRPLLETLVEGLTGKDSILILDNAEHLLDACRTIVDALLDRTERIALLVTTREPLGRHEETVLILPPLQLPEPEDADRPEDLAEIESVRLFLDRAQRNDPDFKLTRENAVAVVETCRRLDGIPLALEIAAARPEQLSSDLPSILPDEERFVSTDRHATLRATIRWSYDLLDAKEQLLLQRLSVFAGGWTSEAAESICAWDGIEAWEILDLLSNLQQKSLVEIDVRARQVTDRLRYRMLETVAAFARSRVESEAKSLDLRHRDHFLLLAEQAAPHLKGPDKSKWLARLEAEHAELRKALDFCLSSDEEAETGLKLAAALEFYWRDRCRWSEWRETTDKLLKRSRPVSAARGQVLSGLGGLFFHTGEFDLALQALDEALAIGRSLEDPEILARALHNKGLVLLRKGKLSEGRPLLEEYKAIHERLGNRAAVATVNCNLGVLAESEGDVEQARRLYLESLAVARDLGDRRLQAIDLNNLGAIAINEADLDHAQPLFEESLAIARELGDRWGMTPALHHLGEIASERGEWHRAAGFYRESLEISRELDEHLGVALVILSFGLLAAKQGEPNRAVRLLAAADAMHERLEAPLTAQHQRIVDEEVERLRVSVGEPTFAGLWTEGHALSTDEAIDTALR